MNKIEDNIWEDNLDKVIDFIKEATKDKYEGWMWINNTQCKYIEIRIDMRDGGFIIKNRDGKRILIEDLQKQ